MTDIHVMRFDDDTEVLVMPIGTGKADLGRMWAELEALQQNGYVVCSTCDKAVPKDERGDVLDSSGRCEECRP